jgi:hypothetical protein
MFHVIRILFYWMARCCVSYILKFQLEACASIAVRYAEEIVNRQEG